MKQKTKQLIMTLVALLALTTHAWADEVTVTFTQADLNGESTVAKDGVTLTPGNNDARSGANFYDSGSNTFSVDKGTFTKIEIVNCTDGDIDGWQKEQADRYRPNPVDYPNSWVDLYTLTWTGEAESVTFTGNVYGIQRIVFTIASGTTVPLTWDAATPNTATLTNGMPAGNVTVSVEYYPQATMDDGAVTAATDVKATTEDALVTIDKSKLTGVAKLMYFVSTDAEATAPAYNATGWTDVLPTAANYTEAGDVKVWYYAVGADSDDPAETYSDGDICAAPLTVTLGNAPLWNAEFDLTNAPEADKAPGVWKTDITGEGVKKGTPVTVTYSGTRKVIGVKAEKKAAPKLLEFEPGGVKFYYYEGETWGEAINNHPENAANGWSIDEDDNYVKNNGTVLHEDDHDDEIKSDMQVNPNIGYIW